MMARKIKQQARQVYTTRHLLTDIWANPEDFFCLSTPEMNDVVRMARQTVLLGQLGHRLSKCAPYTDLASRIQDHFRAAMFEAGAHERMLLWEAEQIQRTLRQGGIEAVFLKGAAYLLEDLPIAHGRIASDVDVLVYEADLPRAEALLEQAGWVAVKTDAYDQTYYRDWMHELPPLRHRLRGTVVDIHHNIVPRTARLKPDGAKLMAASRYLPGTKFRVLCPEDTVLHKAVHLFLMGEFDNSLRELIDLHELFRAYGGDPGFWQGLPARARELDLSRPLYYALRYCHRLMNLAIPHAVTDAVRAGAPSLPVIWLMDRLITTALMPSHPDARPWTKTLARWLLIIRAHWIRMPLPLLIKHFFSKSRKRA